MSDAITITGFDWVPDFARGHVRDLRPRWACEEIGLRYAMRLLDARARQEDYFAEQPWGQVPVLRDGDVSLFESGAILLHLGERDAQLLPQGGAARDRVVSWLFAAYNSVEPFTMQLGTVDIFAAGEEWARLRRPGLVAQLGQRLDRLADALGERAWLGDAFSIADIAMVTVLRACPRAELIDPRPALAAYVDRGEARPAFQRALAAQLGDFRDEPVAA
ncbi:glutathione S-transferase family protein [Sphingomonas baiyangensis]|uniref:Glutathione S-transferase family protein n=1 Tax=Sphingomonas baiyangensis TaxID=2572576 RepID=A0A4U1L8K5_9SPHN|nr:glutathione S-transferase family protein [Sphingomonas baiyangensis]TKD53299.1 glutathione S-transferase family protein [Sphingomonas baiyangensis]